MFSEQLEDLQSAGEKCLRELYSQVMILAVETATFLVRLQAGIESRERLKQMGRDLDTRGGQVQEKIRQITSADEAREICLEGEENEALKASCRSLAQHMLQQVIGSKSGRED